MPATKATAAAPTARTAAASSTFFSLAIGPGFERHQSWDVQFGQRFALTGIAVKQKGQSFVVARLPARELLLHPVHAADHQEHREGDDQEADDGVDEEADVHRHGAGGFRVGERGVRSAAFAPALRVTKRFEKSTLPSSRPIGGMITSATSEEMIPERCADDDADRHVDHVAPHREFLEFLESPRSFSDMAAELWRWAGPTGFVTAAMTADA